MMNDWNGFGGCVGVTIGCLALSVRRAIHG